MLRISNDPLVPTPIPHTAFLQNHFRDHSSLAEVAASANCSDYGVDLFLPPGKRTPGAGQQSEKGMRRQQSGPAVESLLGVLLFLRFYGFVLLCAASQPC